MLLSEGGAAFGGEGRSTRRSAAAGYSRKAEVLIRLVGRALTGAHEDPAGEERACEVGAETECEEVMRIVAVQTNEGQLVDAAAPGRVPAVLRLHAGDC